MLELGFQLWVGTASGMLPSPFWILSTGIWKDDGAWIDTAKWID